MKILSETSANGRVIELTQDEWREFTVLAAAIEGKKGDELYYDFHARYRNSDSVASKIEIDFSGVFGAIQAFYEAKFVANELRGLLDSFDAYLRKPAAQEKPK